MNRVWTALLMIATVIVAGGVVYVLGHNDKVPEAGQTPGLSAPVPQSSDPLPTGSSSTPPVSPSSSISSSSSASSSPSKTPSSSSSSAPSTLIAFVGDDYTHGLGGSGGSLAFPALTAKALGVQEQRFYVDGAGYAKSSDSGETYADLVDKVVAAHPDVVVVTGGRNDRADNAATLETDAADLFSALHSGLPKATLIAVAPWWGDSAHPASLDPVDSAIKSAVTGAGGTYLDLSDPLYGHPDWMADDADPNDDGYAAIATALAAKLKPLLPS